MMKRMLMVGLLTLGAFGVMPVGTANACGVEIDGTTADEKYIGETCTGCGWVKIRGEEYQLFNCD